MGLWRSSSSLCSSTLKLLVPVVKRSFSTPDDRRSRHSWLGLRGFSAGLNTCFLVCSTSGQWRHSMGQTGGERDRKRERDKQRKR